MILKMARKILSQSKDSASNVPPQRTEQMESEFGIHKVAGDPYFASHQTMLGEDRPYSTGNITNLLRSCTTSESLRNIN